jgi:ABC-type bacteriocin/lantibiotic exporter with double-glycine peptidase domain
MAKTKLNVPILAQEKSMCCWHTSAMMIWQYWQQQTGRQGPMNTVAPVYSANTGLSVSAAAFITLASKTGLMRLPSQNTYSSGDLFALLKGNGPLWCAGMWYGFGHVIVLTGIDGGQVFLNDPDGAQRKTETLAWFNQKLLNGLDGCVMAKDPAAY